MTLQYSTTVRNAKLDAVETAIGASAIMKIRTGAAPADCATADAGTVLATLNLPSDWMAAASGGVKAKSGTWEDTSADANGLARHFRVYASDGTTCHLQGVCAMAWPTSTAVVLGQQVVNDGGKAYVCTTAGTTASSGGPTGTGSGISDGTAEWDYVATNDMTLDNVDFAIGQAFTIPTFSITAGNA